ncbi:methionyl-tRNA formyltransferase [Coralloluteibacterium thermophilus]|uniref:Methionyl-tRNA formyltransferase n=1 Tax=Coralloluteibacterium thermophilum TaxID=2707049 RepID=A0ABV9NDX2_9GAMM
MAALRIVFAGTPEFAVPALEACWTRGGEVVAVYTQPDRPAGRGRQPTASPVKQLALRHGLPVRQPASLKSAEEQDALRALAPDVMVVVAYGLILPKAVLAIPRFGCLNVHASLLPRWRGAAPIQRAIQAGDAETGVALMQMEAGLDTGPVLLEKRTPIAPDETAGSLHDRLSRLGAEVLGDGLTLLRAGMRPAPRPQPEAGVTYAHKLEKAEARLDWTQPAVQLARAVRAFHPWPVAEVQLGGERLRIHAAVALDEAGDAEPGTLVRAGRDGLDVATGAGVLRITRLQREGGRPMAAADYLNARPDLLRA